MKINIVVPSTVLGGGIKVIFQYANFWAERGHDVVVYVPMLAFAINRRFNLKTSIANTFKRGTKVKWMDCKFKVRLTPAIKDPFIRNADIVIATAWFTAPHVNQLSSKKGKKVYFIQGYEIWNQDESMVNATYQMPMNRVVITNALRKTLKDKLGVDSTVIYNGHCSEEFFHGEKIIKHPKTVMMLWNSAWFKGGVQGIDILRKMKDKYDIRVILFSSEHKPEVPESFEFYQLPLRKKLMELYQLTDIYLFPSNDESWGLPVIEAMANKCAVVGMNTGCLYDLCSHGEQALIAEQNNYEQLEAYLESIINDEKLLKRLQLNGFNFSEQFNWEKQFIKFEEYLIKLLASGESSSSKP